jgi:integrase
MRAYAERDNANGASAASTAPPLAQEAEAPMQRKASQTTGIRTRHTRSCNTRHDGGRCDCHPTYEAWVFSVRDDRKIRQSFPTLAAAKVWRQDAVPALRKGTMRAPTRQTLDEAAALFVEGIARGSILTRAGVPYKPSVQRTYSGDLRRCVLPALGALRLAELRRADVQAFVDSLVADGRSPSRIHGIVMPLRAICRRAIERDEIVVNPTANVRLPAASGQRERVASPGEAERLLAALPGEDRALWATAFYAGLRRGELRGLACADVDLVENVVRVSRSWDDVEGPVAPKSEKGTRVVPIAGTLRLVLLEQLARTGRRGDDLVFGRSATEPFTPSSVRTRALGAWAATAVGAFLRGESAGLEPIGLHECRHTFVSLMHAAGRSLEEIGDYVGHSSTYMTDRYRHLLDGARVEAAAALDALLAGSDR